MITIVDYDVGNVAALVNMYDDLGLDAEITREHRRIAAADKLILPGVGAFDHAINTLRAHDLVGPLEEAVLGRKVPVLGICLGMQLLARRSEEGIQPGLGWLRADVVRIRPPQGSDLKVPHVGWANVHPTGPSPLFPSSNGVLERFYFVHSYHVVCDRAEDVAATIDYGGPICCAVSAGNVFGMQFHPEKSHRFGKRMLADFGAVRG